MPKGINLLLKISGMTLCYPTQKGGRPLENFCMELGRGEILGLVGPSGCGKTSLGTAITGMVEQPGYVERGEMTYIDRLGNEIDLLALDEAGWQGLRGREIALISQNPVQALNPSRTIRAHFIEAIRAHMPGQTKEACIGMASGLLSDVWLDDPETILSSYPFELSGGMCQRVNIAMALAHKPGLLIADEATTALDVITQSQIMRLFTHIRDVLGNSILLISHDVSMVSAVASRVLHFSDANKRTT